MGKKPKYRLTEKERKHVETGSPFDRTSECSPSIKPGGHTPVDAPVDISAFSYQRVVTKSDPTNFLKKKSVCGNPKAIGGCSAQAQAHRKSKQTAFSRRANPPNTQFRRFYERADLPVQVDQNGSLPKTAWKVPVDKLDFHHYLPLFFDGLREVEYPYSFLAERGVKDMLVHGSHKVLPVVPQLIIPTKTALNTRDKEVMIRVIRILQKLVVAEGVGQALVPYYRQLLPIFNLFKNNNLNLGDGIDYSQQKNDNLGDLINETLALFELHGGDDAFINIKYLIPTYQSVKA
eukprot:maker-scaffold_13-snap-gene-6.67-mRNA-1 protein AED:0.02 eAED:0.02 QI:0/0/0/1/1/1/2/0/289